MAGGNLYPSYGLSGATKTRGISGTTKGGKNCLDVNVLGTENVDFTAYEAKAFSLSGVNTNYNVKTGQSMFGTVASSKSTTIYADATCTIRLNVNTADAITILGGTEKQITGFPITNIFVTTTADTSLQIELFA